MAKFVFEGVNEYATRLKKLDTKAEGMIKRAVYDGAAEVKKAFLAELNALPTSKNRYRVTELPLSGVTQTQKRGLIEGFGLAGMRNDAGFINTKVGFDGYNAVRTKKYPNGQPNALIANAVNSGSSVRKKIPFVNKATKAAIGPCKAAMIQRFDNDTKNIMK